MKNFKFNAITALIIGVNVAVANAADGNILNITTQDAVNANKTIEATNVKGPGHTAIGQQNQIYSIPAAEAEESQGSSSAIGNQNVVKGEQANAIGDGNDAYGHFTQSVGDDNKVYADHSLGYGAHNKVGAQRVIGTPEKDVVVDKNTNKASVFGLNNEVVGKNVFVAGNDNKITDTSTSNATVIGFGATASSANATAIGTAASALANETVAIGQAAKASGQNSNAYGSQANASGTSSLAVGTGSVASGDSAVAIGNDSTVTDSGFAGNTPVAVVSVGSDKTETYTPPDHSTPGRTVTITPHTRQIINVGAGEISAASTDAINGSQLYMVADQVGKNKTRIDNIRQRTSDVKVKAGDNIDVKEVYDDANQVKTYTVSTKKDIKANSYTINNSNIKIDQNGINAGNKKVINVANGENDNDAVNVSQLNKVKHDVANNTKNIATNTQNIANNTKAINTLNKKVNDVDRKSRAGIAGVAAIASAPSARKDGKSMVSTGVAHHRGESAIAIKASRNSDNGHWSTNVNGAADTRGQFTVGAGVGYEW